MTTTLYRAFDQEQRLLYVGISDSPFSRLRQHADRAPWVDQVAAITFQRHETRKEAEAAERAAIRDEKPIHNIRGQSDITFPKIWTVAEVRALGLRTDLVTACQIAYGCGRTRAWAMHHRGELDFPTIKIGRKVVVPVAPLLKLLGLDDKAAA